MHTQLAINGGKRTIPEGFFRPGPLTTALDEQYVLNSLRSSAHAWGENCEQLQTEFAAWNGNRHCLAVSSGTAALHMALVACGCVPGDEVITPAFSWTSSASAILHAHCIPVFVDISAGSPHIDPAKIEAAITPRTRAIIAVHLDGVPADLDPILAVAKKHRLRVIEDACQASGTLYRGRKAGTIGDAATFSLNQNKMFSAGEGGLFVTNDDQIKEQARSMVLFGDFRQPLPDPDYHYYGTGWMYRYNELCAAYARAQLTQLDDNIRHARELSAVLRRELAGVPGLVVLPEPPWARENGYIFVCRVDPAAVGWGGPAQLFREAIVSALIAEGTTVFVWQRRILPELTVIVARNAFGHGSPWREHQATVNYDPRQFPEALAHTDRYFVFKGLRRPNTAELAHLTATAVRKVFANLHALDIEAVARKADVGLYERGWQKHQPTPPAASK